MIKYELFGGSKKELAPFDVAVLWGVAAAYAEGTEETAPTWTGQGKHRYKIITPEAVASEIQCSDIDGVAECMEALHLPAVRFEDNDGHGCYIRSLCPLFLLRTQPTRIFAMSPKDFEEYVGTLRMLGILFAGN